MIEIKKVANKRDLKRFIDLPHELNKGIKQYVPELFIEQKKLFNKNKNPFFKHSSADFFLAFQNRKVVGRIVAIKNENYIEFSGNNYGFFGFFECVNDQSVANALFETAYSWLKDNGLEKMIGPENYTVNESCGILTQGFEFPPAIGMPYNQEYYKKLYEGFGFKTCKKLCAYSMNSENIPPQVYKLKKMGEKQLKKLGILIRPINMKDFDNEIEKFYKIYNSSFNDNWGFVPLTKKEFRFQADGLKDIAIPDIVLFAEKDEEVIGFILTLPDYNQVFIKIKRGRLFPFGLINLLKYKRKIDACRISVMGIKKEYRRMGIAPVLYAGIFESTHNKKIYKGEASYVMDDNRVMSKNIEFLDGKINKRYEIFEKDVL